MYNMLVNKELQEYIESNILPQYSNNDLGHNIDHITHVIKRSFKFADTIPNINYDIVYTVAAYHDIAHYIDNTNHEKISSEIVLKDENLKQFFNDDEIQVISEAVYDHRASLESEPRSIYGKIVSSADRNVSVNTLLKRTYEYTKNNFNLGLEDTIEKCWKHIINKYGENGYALKKVYFKEEEYDKFLNELLQLVKDKEIFTNKLLKLIR